MCVVDLRMHCGSSSDENSTNEYTSNKKGTLTKGCAQKKRLVCPKCDDQSFDTFAHNLPSGPVKAESISTCRIRRAGHYEELSFCISSCGQKKGIFCSKCGGQNFLKFVQHLPLGSVNVW